MAYIRVFQWVGLIVSVATLFSSSVVHAELGDDSNTPVEVIITPKDWGADQDISVDSVLSNTPSARIVDKTADGLYVVDVSHSDYIELKSNPSILIQKNRHRAPMTSDSLLELVSATDVHAAPYSATGSGYAIVIIDTGIRPTHDFFTDSGALYDADTNPSRVTMEYCQSGGFPITDTSGSYILDSFGDYLYEGISTCKGNVYSSTDIDGVTYYSNTTPGTTTSAFEASEPCLAEYPGFTISCIHGSHVAGIAAGTSASYSGTTYSGVAPTADIISFNVFTKYTDDTICGSSSDCLSATDADILTALSQVEDLVVEGTKISAVNMSLGGDLYSDQSLCDSENILYYYAFSRLKALGVPVFVASGNNASKSSITAPACVSTAYSVGATTITDPGVTDEIASYSNVSDFIDILAPGTSVTSANSDGVSTFSTFSGTSMATPVVAGGYTLLRALFDGTVDGYGYRTMSSILDAIISTGVQLDDTRTNGTAVDIPRIDIFAALNELASGPYIALPNASTIDLTYPYSYSFVVTSDASIESTNIQVYSSTTAVYSSLECSAVTVYEYNCSVQIESDGELVLTVTDSASATYTTDAVVFGDIPEVDSITTTVDTGTYSSGTEIPISVSLTNITAPLLSSSTATATLSNGVSVSLTTTGSTSYDLEGSYIVGALGSGEDVSALSVSSISNWNINIANGDQYSVGSLGTPSGGNLDQSGKVITIDVTEPSIISAELTQSGGSDSTVTIGDEVILTLTTNKDITSAVIAINSTTVTSVIGSDNSTITGEYVTNSDDVGVVSFSAYVTDQFGNTSTTITTTTDSSSLEVVASVSSSGGGGGGGASAQSVQLTEPELLSLCSLSDVSRLVEGSVAPDVRLLEIALQRIGAFTSMPNDDYNSATTLAVSVFQQRYTPSSVTGKIDAPTLELIKFYGGCGTNNNKKNPLVEPQTSIQPQPYQGILRKGKRSPLIIDVRNRLSELGYTKKAKKPSPVFTSSLSIVIKKFQKSHKLKATGTINKKTYMRLFGLK